MFLIQKNSEIDAAEQPLFLRWVSNFSHKFLISGPIFILKHGKFSGEREKFDSAEKSIHAAL